MSSFSETQTNGEGNVSGMKDLRENNSPSTAAVSVKAQSWERPFSVFLGVSSHRTGNRNNNPRATRIPLTIGQSVS